MRMIFLLSVMAVVALHAATDKAYIIGEVNRFNVDFFYKSPEARAEIFDKANFVYETDSKMHLAPGNRSTSIQQVREAQAKGCKVCLGPLKNVNEVVLALQTAPDYILLEKSLDKAKLKAAILSQTKPKKNYREPIDLSTKGDFVLNYESSAKLAEGARLRILTYNILASRWNHKPQIAPRAPIIAESIHHFKPDLIGIQEAEKSWYEALDGKVAPYQFVRQKNPTDQGNPSCNILFNALRFRQLDGGILPYTDKWIRCLHWALFEDIKTKERFLFTNTHWDLSVPKRLKNSRMMSEYLKDLKARYDVPIICTGDFNSNTDSEELNLLLKSVGLNDAMLKAPVKENAEISSWYWPINSTTPYKNVKHIDHILVSPELTPLLARLIIDEKLLKASDHLPIVVDLK